jgi:hypothetical protein
VTSGRRRLGRWAPAVTLAESVGFLVPVVTGVATDGRYWPIVAAGLVEGAILGVGQVVGAGGRVLPALRWTAATAAGTAIAWAIGLVPTVVHAPWTDPAVVVLVVAAGAVALLAMPVLQWAATGFRRGLADWIPVSAGARAVGLTWAIAPSPFVDERTPPQVLLLVHVGVGVLMAATVALLTGLAVPRLPGFRRPVGRAGPGGHAPEAGERGAGLLGRPTDLFGRATEKTRRPPVSSVPPSPSSG